MRRPLAERAPIRATLRLSRPVAGRLALATLLGAVAVAAAIGLLGTSGWLISRAAQRPGVFELGIAIVLVQVFGLSRGIARYGERLVGHDAAFRLLAHVRVRVYEALERLAPTGLVAFRRGDLLHRLVADVDQLQDLLLRVIPPYAIAMLVGATTVGVVWWLLPAAALVLLLALLIAAVPVPALTRRLAASSERRLAEVRGELSTDVADLLEGAGDLAAFGATAAQLDRIRGVDRAATRVLAAAATTAGLGSAATVLLTGLAAWGALVTGIVAVHAGRLPGVDLAVVVLIPLAAFEIVVGLPAAGAALERVRGAAGRVFDVLARPAPVGEPAVPAVPPAAPYRLAFRGVATGYAGGAEVLGGLDLDLEPGRCVAVVGPSGAGKTTLATVLLRFLPYAGSVTLNGVELATLAGDDVRRIVGLAEQDGHVFDASLEQNLRLARPDASEAELWAVLGRVQLADWVTGLPDGLQNQAGAHGVRMSGGQRQRLVVARALLAGFPVLLLDEPAEHLDVATADELTGRLLAPGPGRARLLITHRLAGLQAADEVVVLEHGGVVERGSHRVLLSAGGRYAALWRAERAAERDPGPPG